jgi:hypothetical protein
MSFAIHPGLCKRSPLFRLAENNNGELLGIPWICRSEFKLGFEYEIGSAGLILETEPVDPRSS